MSEPRRPPGGYPRSGEHRIAGHGETVGEIAILDDAGGSIAMGLVAANVAYVCFVGSISEDLAVWCVRRLNRLLERGCDKVFLDAHAIERSEGAARTAILEALACHSHGISRIVALVPASVEPLASRVANAVAGLESIVTATSARFDELLADAAPEAHATISVNSCRRVSPSTKPPFRVIRSA